MRLLLIFLILTACSSKNKQKETLTKSELKKDLIALLDTIRRSEQRPIQLRDSLIELYGTESKEVQIQQNIYKKNHIVNEAKIRTLLDQNG